MIEITIRCPELGELARALRDRCPQPETQTVAIGTPVEAVSTSATVAPTPASVPSATTAAAPAAAVPVAPAAAPTYDKETLARAASKLVDEGHQTELSRMLLARFGVPSLMVLPQERYGEFAAALREMGAEI